MAVKVKENAKKPKQGSFMKELLSGSMVTEKIILQNLWYVMLVVSLASLYIANRFHAEKVTRETARVLREVRELRAESLSTSASLMYLSRQSEVYKIVKERGLNLEELKSPPYLLIVDK
jgi:cell division protein FtsL